MMQMYKVYYNNRVILFGEIKNIPLKGKGFKTSAYPKESVATIWKKFKKNSKIKTLYINGNSKKIIKELVAQFNMVKAGGGLVKNKSGEYLLIFRNKKWDLPKGKLEKRETARAGAKREVEEECGIKGLKIIKPLQETYHIYELQRKLNIKQTQWFEMNYSGGKATKPQKEEGIEKAVWVKKKDISKLQRNMYPSIADILINKKILVIKNK
jgi:ADP-ribose pyrophosphatase YjhB (NUDIX family)